MGAGVFGRSLSFLGLHGERRGEGRFASQFRELGSHILAHRHPNSGPISETRNTDSNCRCS
jgi:hypothetical protein